jgi:predicted nucleotidyltransferase
MADVLKGLLPESRAKILTLFMLRPGRDLYLREVAKEADLPTRAVQRELGLLTRLGILVRSDRGNRSYYSVNPYCPVLAELKGLVLKTSGLGDSLRESLAQQGWRIEIAFIYGSCAARTETPDSDIDLMVVGDVDVVLLNRWAARREAEVGRRINYSLFTHEEFAARVREGNEFVDSVVSGPKIMLIGNEEDVRKAAE